MGNCMMALGFKRLKRSVTLLLVGLDNAGKTTAAKGIVGGSLENIVPTVGFSPLKLIYRGCDVTIFDLGGGSRIRAVWTNYFAEVHGVIFVIDSSDRDRISECKEVLQRLLSQKRIAGKPVLVLANKQDRDGALDEIDIVENLNIEHIVNKYKCPTRVETCSANLLVKNKPEKAIADGFRWLIDTIVLHYAQLDKRVTKDIEKQNEKRSKEMEARKERIKKHREQQEQTKKDQMEMDQRVTPEEISDDESLDEVVVVEQNMEKEVASSMTMELAKSARRIFVDTILEENESQIRSNRSSMTVADAEELQELGIQSPESPRSSDSQSFDGSPVRKLSTTSVSAQIERNPDSAGTASRSPLVPSDISHHSNQLTASLPNQFEPNHHTVPMDSNGGISDDPSENIVSNISSTRDNQTVTSIVKDHLELEATRSRKARKPLLRRLNKTSPITKEQIVS